MILGKSGSGKSSSIRTLNPDETVIFNVLKKRLPFKGSAKLYNKEKANLFQIDNYADIKNYLKQIDEKAAKVKNIIIDDVIYLMRKEFFATAKQVGFGKFTTIAANFQSLISTAENLREDLNIFFIFHSEDVVSDNAIVTYKPATVGKLIEQQYNPVEIVPMVLYASIKYDENKKPIYGFYTHRCLEGSIEIPSKSPDGMFDEDFIPNDLNYVVAKINEYYN